MTNFYIVFILVAGIPNYCFCENKGDDENLEASDEANSDTLEIPIESEPSNVTCIRRQNSQMHEIRSASHNQFPFMAALMSQQNDYLCAGTVVANGLILTTAQCSLLPVSYVLLNTTRERRDDSAVMLHAIKSEKFPTYAGSENSKDVAIIYVEQHNDSFASKIKLSNYTRSNDVVDIEAIGFGLNADVGQSRELQYIGLEHRPSYDTVDTLSGYFDCIDTKTLTCFKDTGGPVIFDNQLYGIVVKGQTECTKEISSQYAINKKIVEVLATYSFKNWLDEKIKKIEGQAEISLMTYPEKPVRRANVEPEIETHVLTASSVRVKAYSYLYSIFFHLCIILTIL